MAQIPCPITRTCEPGVGGGPDDNPISNFSSEAPDVPIFTAVVFDPGNDFRFRCGPFIYRSTISQEDAQRGAEELYGNCNKTVGQQYCNPDLPFSKTCPDGSTFEITVLAGTSCSNDSQADADALAKQWADNYFLNYVCDLAWFRSAAMSDSLLCPNTATVSYHLDEGTFGGETQAIADSKAQNYLQQVLQMMCSGGLFLNTAQTCTVGGFSYTVPANSYSGTTPQQANDLAMAFACLMASTPPAFVNTEQHVIEVCNDGTILTFTVLAGTHQGNSQANADINARLAGNYILQVQCLGHVIYPNSPQTCRVGCGAFGSRSFTVQAGTFIAYSQSAADAAAYAEACSVAAQLCPVPGVNTPNIPPQQPSLVPCEAQSATVQCYGGGTFTKKIPAGSYYGYGTGMARQNALVQVTALANSDKACLGDTTMKQCCMGATYYEVIQRTGGPDLYPYVWEVVGSIPNGIYVQTGGATIILAGTPQEAGTFSFGLRCTDTSGSYAYRDYQLRIMSITNDSVLASGVEGDYYANLVTIGGTYAPPLQFRLESGSTLPPGLSLDPDSGIISGTPTDAGTYTFTIEVEDSSSDCLVNFTNDPTLAAGEEGEFYANLLTVGGTYANPVRFLLANGTTLPPGLSLDQNSGVISGVPSMAGDYTFQIRVEDSTV